MRRDPQWVAWARAELLAEARRRGCDCMPIIRVPEFLEGRLVALPEVNHTDECMFYDAGSRSPRRRRYGRRRLPPG